MKERIRTNLKMLEDNLDSFNDTALQFIDKEKINTRISEWRWYVSHDYFKKGWPKPTGYNSNPPFGWLHSELLGLSVPLSRDIGTCIAPEVESGLKTEHAARRIMNRLDMLYGYVSADDALRSQQDHRDREDKPAKDRARAAKARVDRKAERELEHQKFIEKEGPKLGKKYLKDKEQERKVERERRELTAQSVRQLGRKKFEGMKEAMKERRK